MFKIKRISTVIILFFILSCEEIINEPNIEKDTIHIIAPTNNVTLKTNTKIQFNWEALQGATDYHLQIAKPSFNNANQLVIDTIVTQMDFLIDSLAISEYQWRVNGQNSAFETAYTTNSFVVEE